MIRECFLQSGPVYIFLPLDLSAELLSTSLLEVPINIHPTIDATAQGKAVSAILSTLSSSKSPAVLVDALAHRFNAGAETRAFVSKLHVPFYSAAMGKGLVDETEEMYVGLYNGEVGTPGVGEAATMSDLIITLGLLPADTNSGGFSRVLDEQKTIHINPFDVVVYYSAYL